MKTLITTILFFIITSFTIAQSTIDSGLVAYYPFNGNADDQSENSNNGIINGALLTVDRFGNSNSAYQFNGTADNITVPDNATINPAIEITLSAWVKRTRYGIDMILEKGGDWTAGTCNYGMALHQINNNMFYFFFNGGWRGTDGVSDFEWHHYAVVAQHGSANPSLYIDGDLKTVQYSEGSASINLTTSTFDLHIGAQIGTATYYGANIIDEVRIYNRILNNTEILTLYQDSTTSLPAWVDSVYPHQNSHYFQQNETIKVFFSQPMDSTSIVSANTTWRRIYVHGSLTGKHLFDVSYSSVTNSLEILPTTTLKYGELITVSLDSLILTASGNNLKPYVFQFNVKPENGSVKFAVADSFQLNFPPINIVSGDFNNDGKIDVIVSNYDSSKYTILLNNGSGGFTLGEELAGPFKPYSISFTDIDNDRDLDMIVSTNEQNKIRVLRGTGQGIFSWILPNLDVTAPIATCPGDFDGDGDNDFVALCNTGNAILYKNDGTGFFTPSDSTAVNIPATIRNVIGDIDNDGDLDIIAGHSDYFGQFKILRNDGNGGFTSEPGMNLGAHPDEFAGGDFDGDYDLDFVHCSWYMNGISLILNDGQGNYNDYLNLGNVGGQTRNPVVNDFDGDGDQDFVGVFSNSNVGILKNNIHPNYKLYLSYPLSGLKGIASADFDNNGSVDLVGISSTKNQIKFLKNCVDSLVAYYPFDGNTQDQSGNINDGINYNGVYSPDRYANDNSSIYFDGGDSYVMGLNPGNNLPEGNSARTISAWIRSFEAANDRNIFHYGYDIPASTNYHLLLTSGRYAAVGNGWGYGLLNSTSDIGDTTWHLLTAVYDGSITNLHKIYIDGKLDTAGNISNEPNTTLTTNWKIGRFMGGGQSFLGNIDELKVYNTALSEQQIRDMYKATTTAPDLLYPENNSVVQNTFTPLIDWDSTVTASAYRLLIAKDSLFSDIIFDSTLSTSYYQVRDEKLRYDDNFYWKVRTINDGGIGPWSESFFFSILFTDVAEEIQLPAEFALIQNYPNPFNPSTIITYHLPNTAHIELKVYDVLGNEISTLVNEEKDAGIYNIQFTMNDLSSGIYMYKLTAVDPSDGNSIIQIKKMMLLK